MPDLPTINHAVILPDYNTNLVRAILGLKKGERPIRKLKDNELLIKMEAAPCNPSDIAFIRGGYNIKKTIPAVPGFEGAGIAVEGGKDTRHFIGKRISSFTQADSDGTWAEYFITRAEDCLILRDDIDINQAGCLSINPFTAFGLIEMALKQNCRTIIQNAGGGQIAEFVRILAGLNSMEVINIVRKEEHVQKLKADGASIVLNSTQENFKNELKVLAHQLGAGMAFDAVGGEQTGILLNTLPDHSKVIVYGGLAGGLLSAIEPFDIIFRDKKLIGFNLTEWKQSKTNEDFLQISDYLQQLIIDGKIRTKIQGEYKLDYVIDGIRAYIKSMSEGKIIFTP